jgi:lipopolysaccharide biosynthesis regulator YciM
MLLVKVVGGTAAGVKRALRPQSKADWECSKCHARNKFYWTNCPNCGTKRGA